MFPKNGPIPPWDNRGVKIPPLKSNVQKPTGKRNGVFYLKNKWFLVVKMVKWRYHVNSTMKNYLAQKKIRKFRSLAAKINLITSRRFWVFLACTFCVFAVFLLLFIYILGGLITQTAYPRTVGNVILNIEAIFPMCDFYVWCNELDSVSNWSRCGARHLVQPILPIQITFNHNN